MDSAWVLKIVKIQPVLYKIWEGRGAGWQNRAGIFGHTQNVVYVAKSGPIGLISSAIGKEFQGEANSGIRLAPQCDFHANLKKFRYLG